MSTVITDTDARDRIAANVGLYLQKRGMSQSDLARATGDTTVTISNIVNAKHIPRAGLLARIAEALDVTTDMLLSGPK